MLKRYFLCSAAALAFAAGATALVHGQSATATKLTPEQIAAELRKPAKGFVQPKTPWGDPDISGVWTSDAALGIARERDAKYAGRPFLTDEEYNEAHKADEQRRVAGENAVGAFRNDGAWKTKSYRQTSLVIEPEDGRTPAFTEKALERTATRDRGSFGEGPFDSPLDFTLYDRCITRGIVGSVMPVVYGNGNRIIQAPGQVIISYEMVHDTRVIYTDGRPHVGPRVRQYLGDPRGHWEGNTLVIETTNFLSGIPVGNTPASEVLRVVERFTLADADTLSYQLTVDDQKTWTKPWTVAFPLKRSKDYQVFEYACHEGNYYMYNALSGARAEEKKK